jgi:DNA-binding CsgD family transcriptional regulator
LPGEIAFVAFRSLTIVDASVAHAAIAASFAAVAGDSGADIRILKRNMKGQCQVHWMVEMAALRRRAIYLAVVAYGCPQRAVARALGVSHVAVLKQVRRVEDERDDPALDRWLDRMERRLVA